MRLGFFLAKPLDFLHLCMGGDIHKINTNLILLTGPDLKLINLLNHLKTVFKNDLKQSESLVLPTDDCDETILH
jgi:hypothetical protein